MGALERSRDERSKHGEGLALLAALAVLGGCAHPDPQSELERLIQNAEAAAEARDTGFFRELISERYVDARGRDREQLVGLVRGYFLTHPEIEVSTRIEETLVRASDVAELTVRVSASAPRGGSFLGRGAQQRRVRLELVREGGDWQVIGASWSRLDADVD